MASRAQINSSFANAVDMAVAELLRVRKWGDTTYINLPLIFPGGSFATVRVNPAPGGFYVDDGGFAYRELESVGAERSFGRTAAKIAEDKELEVSRRSIVAHASPEELACAICDVAMASWEVADKVYSRLSEGEAEIEDYLRERLVSIFGATKVDDAHKIVGSSTNEWEVSAIAHIDGGLAVFQAVGNHANSIYRTSAAFHDLAELPSPPRLVAVVKDKKALGPKLIILSQAGRVIQSDQPDDDYWRAAA